MYAQANILADIGDAQHALGNHQAAADAWQSALTILNGLNQSVGVEPRAHDRIRRVKTNLAEADIPPTRQTDQPPNANPATSS